MNIGLILDDHDGAQVWLREVLSAVYPSMSVSVASDLASARDKLRYLCADGLPPELALVDLSLPDGTGLDFIRELRKTCPECLCVVVSIHDDDHHVFPALRVGAQGYLLKHQPKAELVASLEGMVQGQPPLSPSIAQRVLATFLQEEISQAEALTPREQEVLELIAKGYTLVNVAEALGISRHTVASFVKNIYRKLEVSSRAEATREAIRMGLVQAHSHSQP